MTTCPWPVLWRASHSWRIRVQERPQSPSWRTWVLWTVWRWGEFGISWIIVTKYPFTGVVVVIIAASRMMSGCVGRGRETATVITTVTLAWSAGTTTATIRWGSHDNDDDDDDDHYEWCQGGLWDPDDDCCEKKCTSAHPCGEGEGSCQDDSGCENNHFFFCGSSNCHTEVWRWRFIDCNDGPNTNLLFRALFLLRSDSEIWWTSGALTAAVQGIVSSKSRPMVSLFHLDDVTPLTPATMTDRSGVWRTRTADMAWCVSQAAENSRSMFCSILLLSSTSP